MQKKISSSLTSILSSVLVFWFSTIYIYSINAVSIPKKELFALLGYLLLGFCVVFILLFLFLRDIHKSALVASIFGFLASNLGLFQKAVTLRFPFWHYWHFVFIAVSLIVLAIALIRKRLSSYLASQVNLSLLLIFFVLIAFNVITNASTIFAKNETSMSDARGVKADGAQSPTKADKPNIYYFIFDEYSSLDALERYCSFDNSDFYNYLENIKFNVSYTSRNYSYRTVVEIPNILNLDFVLDDDKSSADLRQTVLESPTLFNLVRSLGYYVSYISDQNYFAVGSNSVDEQINVNDAFTSDESLFSLVRDNSAFYILNNLDPEERIKEVETLFLASEQNKYFPNQSRFTFSYIMFPHVPWVVDENGKGIDISKRYDLKDCKAYVGQLQYATKLIKELVQNILTDDPKSVIILQSDHSFRQAYHLNKMYNIPYKDADLDDQMMRSIFNAVYFEGQPLDIESLSGMNTARLVIGKLLNIELPEIEEPK